VQRILLIGLLLFSFLLAEGQDRANVNLISTWTRTDLPSLPDGSVFNDVCGFSIDGIDYAAILSTAGTHIISISATGELSEKGFVPGAFTGPGIVNRDAAEYDGYLYAICDHGYSTLQIIDLHFLPDSVVVVYDSDSLVERAHSVVIDSLNAKMYVCGPSSLTTGARALDIFSLADPVQPVLLGSFDIINYVHDCYVRNDTAWLNCANDGVMVVNFANVLFPSILGSLEVYPELGYNHSGWLSESGEIYVFTDETAGKSVKVCDASDPNDMQVLSLFSTGNLQSIAHNPVLIDNYVYLSYYFDGLQIFDISEPGDPVRAGWYDTHEENENLFSGAWGIHVFKNGRIVISDRQKGLFLFEFTKPPRIETTSDFGFYPNPSSGIAWFYYQDPEENKIEIKIFDAAGRLVMNDSFYPGAPHYFNFSSLNAGAYFYSFVIEEKETRGTGKFILSQRD
jgi:choice-of-anchor B domain-containing protein